MSQLSIDYLPSIVLFGTIAIVIILGTLIIKVINKNRNKDN
ncbi:hypothetical protein [Senegalia massiliensis]|nr:hypothetical protein [Senegalia massiliensis]